MPNNKALKILIEGSGDEFDTELVHLFVRCIGLYPVGALVLLKSGKIAFVLSSNRINPSKPIVRMFYSTNSKCFIEIRDLNLDRQDCPDQILRTIEAQDYNIDQHEIFQRMILEHTS
jgi:hypothetical protein